MGVLRRGHGGKWYLPTWQGGITWLNHHWDAAGKGFLQKINTEMSRLWVKQMTLQDVVGIVQSIEGPTSKETAPLVGKKRTFCL